MNKHFSSITPYLVIALVLGIITFLEFALVEYDFAFLTPSAVLFWLIVLGIAKLAAAAVLAVRLFRTGFTGLLGGVAAAVGALALLSLLFTAQNFARVGQEPEPVVEAPQPVVEAPPPAEEFDWQALGGRVYATSCLACHQANGQGIPGVFPPLAGHAPELYNVPGGRELLIKTVLYGLVGPIVVDGVTYNALMPAFPQLSDADIAAVLNYTLTEWGNDALLIDFVPYGAEEVAAQRDLNLSPSQVHELRQALGFE